LRDSPVSTLYFHLLFNSPSMLFGHNPLFDLAREISMLLFPKG
jgi:hypothetical protein